MPSYQQQDRSSERSQSQVSEEQVVNQLRQGYGNGQTQAMLRDGLPERPGAPAGMRAPYNDVYDTHAATVDNVRVALSESQMRDVQAFQEHYQKHHRRYEQVSSKTNMPPRLIAALHWRESTGDFGTYLHQGDRLGRPAVNVPRDIPVFHVWEDAAVHALNLKSSIRDQTGITADSTNAVAQATYSEAYNGLGYHYRNKPSPYVYSGTTGYSSGKYVRDSVYSHSTVDRQTGVLPLLGSVGGLDTPQDMSPRQITKEDQWMKVVAGSKTLRRGAHGAEVEVLQLRLSALGYNISSDGDFGSGTDRAVREFQSKNGLTVDGVVGKGTASAIEERQNTSENSRPSGAQ